MFKIIIICFIIIFSFLSLQAEDVSGNINGETWIAENSPYNVVGSITVEDLIIEPGVEVLFNGDHSFTITGTFSAVGTSIDSIFFKPGIGNFNGLIFNSSSAGLLMDYCSVSGSTNDGIRIILGNVKISNSVFKNNSDNGFELENATAEVINSIFKNNSSDGISLLSGANATLYSVRVTANNGDGINSQNGSINAYNVIIDHNSDEGLFINDGTYLFENIVVADNSNHGLFSLVGNIIVRNSIFYNNTVPPTLFVSSGTLDTTYSNIDDISDDDLDVPTINGNIDVNPEYNSVDYRLAETSKCIDAGNPSELYYDLYFPPSKGGNRNDMGAYGGEHACKWFYPIFANPINLPFGNVNYDESLSKFITITNYSGNQLNIENISITGSNIDKFNVANLPSTYPLIMNKGDSTQFEVVFTPYEANISFTANLNFESNLGFKTTKLSGKGVSPFIYYQPESEYDFGQLDVGDSSLFDLILLNAGVGVLKINSIIIPDQDVYNVDFEPIELSLNQSDTFKVKFKPKHPESYDDKKLFIFSNDPGGGIDSILLSGQGMAPEIAAQQDNIDFGQVDVFTIEPSHITLNNTGNKDLIVTKTFLSGPDTDQFNLITEIDSDSLLIPDASMDLDLEFVPNIRADLSSTLNITSNDPNTDTLKIPLQGRSVAADLTISREIIDFGNIHLPMDSELTVEIGNAGERQLTVDTLYFEDSEDSVFTLIDAITYFNINEGKDPQSIRIAFAPADDITYYDRLVIVSNDYLDDTLRIEVTGRGVTPHIAYGTNFLGFNDVWLGESLILTKIINNEGSADLIVKNIQITGVNASRFMIDDKSDSLIIQPDASDSLKIQYTPQTLGTDLAQLQFTSNDLDNPNITVSLSGRGVAAYISSDSTFLNFGNVKSNYPVTRSLKFENTGNTNLEIQQLLIEGTGYKAFYIQNLPLLPIIVGPESESDDITIVFDPNERMKSNAVLNIISNAYQQDTLAIKLNATSNVAGVPYLFLYDDSVHIIGNAVVTGDSLFPLNIENISDDVGLEIYNIEISGPDYSSFSIEFADLPFEIGPLSSSDQRKLSFRPMELRTYTCTITIHSNDTIASPNIYTIHATGIPDPTPPQILLDTLATQLSLNSNGVFITMIRDQESTIQKAVLFIRKAGDVHYDSLDLDHDMERINWSTNINSDLVTEFGLEYFIKIEHGGIISTLPLNGNTNPAALSVRIPEFNFPMSTLAKDYQMISVPFNSKGQTLADLFGDELGSYDNTKYRIFDWDQVDTVFVEQKEMNAKLPPGKALYLITKKSKQLNINDCQTVLTDEAFTIDLKAGWNMISIPYAFNILWSDIHPSTNGTDLKYWNGTEMINPTVLEPFKGYGFFAETETTLVIPVIKAGVTKIAKQLEVLSEGEWHFQIEAQRGRYADRFNFAGVRNSSHDKIDHWDSYEAPGIGDYISLFFTENTDDNNQIKLCADYKNKNNEFYQFDFEYKSTFSGKTLLNLVAKNLPDTYDWAVITREGEVILPKGEISSSQRDKQYRLIVGNYEYLNSIKSEFNTLPDKFSVSQNYPNPFNPVTKITIAMPKEAYITADIYNVLGERIKRIANNVLLSEGYHDFSWDGKNEKNFLVSSGIYFFTFRTQNYVKTIKMILQR